VVDFIYSGFWPTFNLADASIVTGAVLIAIISIRSERSSRRSQLGS
jgi:signal peptidase II